MKTVFLTGISGFVGAHLAKRLVAKGYSVIGIVRDMSHCMTLDKLSIRNKVTLIQGDILDGDLVRRILVEYRPDQVYHLAAQAIVSNAVKMPTDTFTTNCVGTSNLLEAIKDVGTSVKAILVCSTDKVYGEGMDRKEFSPLDASGVYELSKISEECVSRAFIANYGLPIVVSRACNIYGPYDANRRIVPNVMRAISEGVRPVIFKDDDSLREYIYVDDVCDAYIALLENIEKTSGTEFNIGSGDVITQEDMVKRIINTVIEITGCEVIPEYKVKPEGLLEIQHQSLDSSKIKDAIGWKAAYDLSRGLRETWEIEHVL